MFEKIIFATDLSPATDTVIACLAPLRKIGVREIVLTHALGIRHLDDMRYELLRQVEPHLKRQQAALEAQGFAVCIRAPRGLPTEEIVRVTEEQAADLVVVGSHGHTLAHDVLLGSTPLELLHRSPVPVLVVRVKIEGTKEEPRCGQPACDLLAHVLFATDFSDNAEVAFQYLKKIAQGGAAAITLLHVQDVTRMGGADSATIARFDQIDLERLERRRTELAELGATSITCHVAHGHATEEILKRARENASLVVLGSQGRGFFKEIFLGSTSHNLARHAPCPVLVVPQPR